MLTESTVESACLDWFTELGFNILHGPDIAPGEILSERADYRDVILHERFRSSLIRINPLIPNDAIEDAIRKILHPESPSLVINNHSFHQYLVNGIPVEYVNSEGRNVSDFVNLIDFKEPNNNDWLAVNQFTVIENNHNRRPDIVIFINGLPLAVIELKNPADENADIWSAYNQFQTYKQEIQSLFTYNEILVISDGLEGKIGSLTSEKEWFLPWRTIEGEEEKYNRLIPQLETLIKGLFQKERFLNYLQHFIVFEKNEKELKKKIAGYHQFHAVNIAIEKTIEATRPKGNKRCGVVWHTQGSGKSLTMVFYTGKLVLEPKMENPTIVVLTDRIDLDQQLYDTFCACQDILRQTPIQAKNRDHLRELLNVAAGGVIFTNIQKFFPQDEEIKHPLLSPRRNIVVIADEAHRSQYDFIDGFARNMRDALPNASFIAFTGTPIELKDRSTMAVFGDYISIYDIQRAVEDNATKPIYYESRIAKLELSDSEKPKIDPEFEEVTEGEEVEKKEKLKTKWAALEGIVGAEKRIHLIARDIVTHFQERLQAMDGKAMIVCMSRRICVDLYNAIIKIRPQWHSPEDDRGFLKVVMTGSATDPVDWQQHIRNKERRKDLANRFKKPDESFKMVIVRDMWLTGFDCPPMHTMYIDKPMHGHSLMQAIARVNRVYKDKPGGLVVDYIGLAPELKKALAVYTESGGKGNTAIDQEEAVAVLLEKYEICCQLFNGFDWSVFHTGKPEQRLRILPSALEHILKQTDGKNRLIQTVTELSAAFALSVPNEKAMEIIDDVAFFQAVKAALVKSTRSDKKPIQDIEFAIRQIIAKAVVSDEVIDILKSAGIKKPDISILSDEFLDEVRNMPQKNLAVELLNKLLNDELKIKKKKNLVQSRSFAEMLEKTIRQYQNRAIETAEVLSKLIEMAKEMREADKRGEKLNLRDDELAFYDALETNDSAVKILGDEVLRKIAIELVDTVRKNTSIDWTVKENVKAKLRVMVKRILRKYDYPPDKQEKATQTVLEQAELLSADWAA
jgi:type I restriction enzyme, R subunit